MWHTPTNEGCTSWTWQTCATPEVSIWHHIIVCHDRYSSLLYVSSQFVVYSMCATPQVLSWCHTTVMVDTVMCSVLIHCIQNVCYSISIVLVPHNCHGRHSHLFCVISVYSCLQNVHYTTVSSCCHNRYSHLVYLGSQSTVHATCATPAVLSYCQTDIITCSVR